MIFGELNLATIFSRIFLLSLLLSNNSLAEIATGTGFFISQNGYLVTCFHVIEGAKVIAIRDSSGKTHPASVVRTDSNNDLALLKVNGRFNSLPIANSGVAKRGAEVITVGFPHIDVQGAEPKVTDGIINSLTGIADDPRHFQISVPVQSGNSGGPLVSMSGNVVGVVSSKLSALKMFKSTGDLPQNVNYAIKSNYLLELVSTITGLKAHLNSPFLTTKRNLSDLTEQVERATVLVLVDTEQTNSAIEASPKSGSLPLPLPKSTIGGEIFKDCAYCPEMVAIPSGSFDMGSNNGEKGHDDTESPIHRVKIKRFAIGKNEITVGQFAEFISETGYKAESNCRFWHARARKQNSDWQDVGYSQSPNSPVVCIRFQDAQAYAEWLSGKTQKTYRLPTEAEWEYAARAGSRTAFSWGNEVGTNNGNCNGCGSQWDNEMTAPVGSFKPNGFGIYDMVGNVQEWVEDCWHDNYTGAPADGSAWKTGDCNGHILRGGSWNDASWGVRAARRKWDGAPYAYNDMGFRLVKALSNY